MQARVQEAGKDPLDTEPYASCHLTTPGKAENPGFPGLSTQHPSLSQVPCTSCTSHHLEYLCAFPPPRIPCLCLACLNVLI